MLTHPPTTAPTVNGHHAEPGCYVDCHHGQYAPDRLADVAASFGLYIADDDHPATWRRIADIALDEGRHADAGHAWDHHHDATDRLLDRLNAVTTGTARWGWNDGDIGLYDDETGMFGCEAPSCGAIIDEPHYLPAPGTTFDADGIAVIEVLLCESCHRIATA